MGSTMYVIDYDHPEWRAYADGKAAARTWLSKCPWLVPVSVDDLNQRAISDVCEDYLDEWGFLVTEDEHMEFAAAVGRAELGDTDE